MRKPSLRLRLRRAAVALLVLTSLVLAGCGGTGSPGSGRASDSPDPSASASSGSGSGTVRVLYAGSLVNVMEKELGPAFAQSSGDDYQGYGAGSSQVAHEISGKTRRGDVFISADPEVNRTLEGSAHGDWVSWYATFARSPLVIGYNPKSRFAADLRSKPWYDVVTEPGFKLGRTDPQLDPKGELTSHAVDQVARDRTSPELSTRILASSTVFPEQELVGRLQSGQLDAGFFYSIETNELDIPTVQLDPVHLAASYTVTVLNRSENRSGGADFAAFLLGSRGRAILKDHGFALVTPPTRNGPKSAVPAELISQLAGP